MTYRLEVELRHRIAVDDERDDQELIEQYQAQIDAFEDGEEDPVVVGHVSFAVIKLGLALNAGLDAFDACDSIAQETHDLASAVLDPATGQLRDDIIDAFEGPLGDLLFLIRLEISTEHRGQNLGLVVVDRIVDAFGDGLVVGLPALDDVDPATPTASRFRRYWERLGFRAIAGTDIVALNAGLQRPKVALRSRSGTANDNRSGT